MGTRALTTIINEEKQEIAVIYSQWDGYPSGHGQDLYNFLKDIHLVNGLTMNEKRKVANGMECLAMQLIAHFKQSPGNYYLMPAGTRDCGEEYLYTIYNNNKNKLCMTIQMGSVTFFGLPGTKQKNMPVLFDGLVKDFCLESIEAAEESIERKQIRGDIQNESLL